MSKITCLLTFPEFGLAGNIGAIIGPRFLTSGLDLNGKYFLHDYDWTRDSDGAKLANILSGPGRVMQMISALYNFTVFDSLSISPQETKRVSMSLLRLVRCQVQEVHSSGVCRGKLSEHVLIPLDTLRFAFKYLWPRRKI